MVNIFSLGCHFLVQPEDNSYIYCLMLKIWNEPFPPQYQYTEPGSLEEVEI